MKLSKFRKILLSMVYFVSCFEMMGCNSSEVLLKVPLTSQIQEKHLSCVMPVKSDARVKISYSSFSPRKLLWGLGICAGLGITGYSVWRFFIEPYWYARFDAVSKKSVGVNAAQKIDKKTTNNKPEKKIFNEIVTPTKAIEILKKKGALLPPFDKNNASNFYQIKVLNQIGNDCWMHGPRNASFLTAMFSGVTESEFNNLYEDMTAPKNFDTFKNRINEFPEKYNPAERKEIIYPKDLPGLLQPKLAGILPANINILVQNGAIVHFLLSLPTKALESYIRLIKTAQKLDNTATLNLAYTALAAQNGFMLGGKAAEKAITNLNNNTIPCISFIMTFKTTNQLHATALTICKEDNQYYFFFADSLNNNPYTSFGGRGGFNIDLLKNFVQGGPSVYKEGKLIGCVNDFLNELEYAKNTAPEDLKAASFWEDFTSINAILRSNLHKLDLFKTTYKEFLRKEIEEKYAPKPDDTKAAWDKINKLLKTLEIS